MTPDELAKEQRRKDRYEKKQEVAVAYLSWFRASTELAAAASRETSLREALRAAYQRIGLAPGQKLIVEMMGELQDNHLLVEASLLSGMEQAIYQESLVKD